MTAYIVIKEKLSFESVSLPPQRLPSKGLGVIGRLSHHGFGSARAAL